MKRLFMFITWFLTTSVQASDHLFYPDLRMMGMGGFQVTQSQYVNPALLPVLEERTIHLGCYDSYGLRELMTMGAACSYPNPWLSAGLDVASFGYDAYRESQARLSLAKALGKGWSLGVAFRYRFLQSELETAHVSALSTDVGVVCQPVDNLLIGLLIQQWPSVQLAKTEVDYQSVSYYAVQIGFHYRPINSLLMAISMGTTEQERFTAHIGMEYVAWENFSLRMGMQTHPFLPTAGVGWRMHHHWGMDVACHWHQTLGITSGIGLSYYF